MESIKADCACYGEGWNFGLTLIADSYFDDYAREFASDIGAIDDADKWPCNCIDWGEASAQLKQDYQAVDFDGDTYCVRG